MTDRPLKIAFSGAHSTGKTTACMALADWLASIGVGTARIPEVARSCPWPVNREATPEAQRWIFHMQAVAELEAEAAAARPRERIQAILCDRTILDGFAYSLWHRDGDVDCLNDGSPWAWADLAMEHAALDWLPSYGLVYMTVPDRAVEPDGFRDTDAEWQAEIAANFRKIWAAALGRLRRGGLRLPRKRPWPGLEAAKREILKLLGRRDD